MSFLRNDAHVVERQVHRRFETRPDAVERTGRDADHGDGLAGDPDRLAERRCDRRRIARANSRSLSTTGHASGGPPATSSARREQTAQARSHAEQIEGVAGDEGYLGVPQRPVGVLDGDLMVPPGGHARRTCDPARRSA